MGDIRKDGHHHKSQWPKLTERGWVWEDGEITPYTVPQSFDTVERPDHPGRDGEG